MNQVRRPPAEPGPGPSPEKSIRAQQEAALANPHNELRLGDDFRTQVAGVLNSYPKDSPSPGDQPVEWVSETGHTVTMWGPIRHIKRKMSPGFKKFLAVTAGLVGLGLVGYQYLGPSDPSPDLTASTVSAAADSLKDPAARREAKILASFKWARARTNPKFKGNIRDYENEFLFDEAGTDNGELNGSEAYALYMGYMAGLDASYDTHKEANKVDAEFQKAFNDTPPDDIGDRYLHADTVRTMVGLGKYQDIFTGLKLTDRGKGYALGLMAVAEKVFAKNQKGLNKFKASLGDQLRRMSAEGNWAAEMKQLVAVERPQEYSERIKAEKTESDQSLAQLQARGKNPPPENPAQRVKLSQQLTDFVSHLPVEARGATPADVQRMEREVKPLLQRRLMALVRYVEIHWEAEGKARFLAKLENFLKKDPILTRVERDRKNNAAGSTFIPGVVNINLAQIAPQNNEAIADVWMHEIAHELVLNNETRTFRGPMAAMYRDGMAELTMEVANPQPQYSAKGYQDHVVLTAALLGKRGFLESLTNDSRYFAFNANLMLNPDNRNIEAFMERWHIAAEYEHDLQLVFYHNDYGDNIFSRLTNVDRDLQSKGPKANPRLVILREILRKNNVGWDDFLRTVSNDFFLKNMPNSLTGSAK